MGLSGGPWNRILDYPPDTCTHQRLRSRADTLSVVSSSDPLARHRMELLAYQIHSFWGVKCNFSRKLSGNVVEFKSYFLLFFYPEVILEDVEALDSYNVLTPDCRGWKQPARLPTSIYP